MVAPGRTAASAACWAASTTSYIARCGPLKRPLTGKVRVMSAESWSTSQPASISTRSPSATTSAFSV